MSTRKKFDWWRILSWILVVSFLLPLPMNLQSASAQEIKPVPQDMGEIPIVGQKVVSVAETDRENCYYTGVSQTDGSAVQQNFMWHGELNAYYNNGVSGSPLDPPLGQIQVTETTEAGGGTTTRMLVEARVVSAGTSADRMIRIQLPAGQQTIGQTYPNGNWQTFQWQRSGSLSYPQTGLLLAQGGSNDTVWVGLISVIRCYESNPPTATPTRVPPTSTPTQIPPTSTLVPTLTPTRVPPTPTNTPSPSPSPTPITDPVTSPEQGAIVENVAQTCSGVVYMPAVTGGNNLAAAAAESTYIEEVIPAGAQKINVGACMVPPTPHCTFQWDKVWDVIFTDMTFGELWVCGDEAWVQSPVMVMATTPTSGTPAGLLVIGGVFVLAGLQQWTSYTISHYEGPTLPDGALLFDTVEDAKNWIAGQFFHPVTIGSNPIRVEQYREDPLNGGGYNATVRWYSNNTSGTQFSVVRDTTNTGVTSATVVDVQIVTGNNIIPTTVGNYRVERGIVPGAQTYPSVDIALGWVFRTQVQMPEPVAEAPEVPHVANHPRPDERPKKIAGWRVAFAEWFNGGDPNWCGRRADGAMLIVFYRLVVQKTTGGFYRGIGLILHTNGVSDSTVMTDVKPTDGDPNNGSPPKSPTYEPFEEIPCPSPFAPAR